MDSLDWTQDATADSVYNRVMERTVNGAIVVLHFDSPTTVRSTAVALPRLIDDLRAQGYEPATITDLRRPGGMLTGLYSATLITKVMERLGSPKSGALLCLCNARRTSHNRLL